MEREDMEAIIAALKEKWDALGEARDAVATAIKTLRNAFQPDSAVPEDGPGIQETDPPTVEIVPEA